METQLPHRKHLRLSNFDYTYPTYYFITIVINDRLPLLGSIDNCVVNLSPAGETVFNTIEEIPSRFDKTEIVEYIVMPNHLHIIIFNGGEHYIPDIVRWLKSVTTNRYIHGVKEQGWPQFNKKLWLRDYYEHIIRNHHSFENIIRYIRENPIRWSDTVDDEDINGLPETFMGVPPCTSENENDRQTGVHGGTPLQNQTIK